MVMRVTAVDTSSATEHHHACDNFIWQDGISYAASTETPIVTMTNQSGCDSVVHLNLTVDYTHYAVDQQQACDSMLWIDGHWYFADIHGPTDTIRTVADCDSIVTLDLAVHYSIRIDDDDDTCCFGGTCTWRRFSVGEVNPSTTTDYYLTDTLRTIHNCDSVLAIHLTQMSKPQLEIEKNIDCWMQQYRLTLTTDVPYSRWWAEPADPAIDGIENSTSIIVAPETATDYYVLVDYHKTPLCPLSDHISLPHIEVPQAEIKVNPEALTLSNTELDAYDISVEYQSRDWYINWQRQSESSRHLYYNADISLDSVIVALSVYNGICHDTALRVIPIIKTSLFVPNAFTPTLETNNRFFFVSRGILEAELFIYNREGLLIYHTTNIDQGWDGHNSRGTLCPQGSYVWKLIYRSSDRPNSDRTEIGTVMLLR